MNGENYWEQFMTSGRIEDYLAYTAKKEDGKCPKEGTSGEYPYAGFLFCDGDGAKPDTCW